MDQVEVTWPTLHPLRHDVANRLAEHPRTPPLAQTPINSINHTAPQLQPDLYLQLSQILEWEIWNHNQTRGGLCAELIRRTELETQISKLNHELAQWQEGCRTAHAALHEHRTENSNLKLDVEALTDELRHLRQLQGHSSPPSTHDDDKKAEERTPQLPLIEREASSWRLGFIRDIEEP